MKKESIFTGKTVDEALKLGLAELDLTEENVEWEIIEAEKKGILGIGATPAKIKIVYNEKKDGSVAVGFIKTILEDMKIEADVDFEKTGSGRYKLSVNGEAAGMLIRHHGDTLDALQYLVNLAVNKREDDGSKGEYMNITLDIENYRKKREDALRSLAKRMANKVLKYRRSVVLEPMLPYERRIIHSEIQGIEGVSTNSIGIENNRKVVIFLEEVGFEASMEKDRRSSDRRQRGDRGDRGGRNKGERRQSSSRSGGGSRKSSIDAILPRIKKPAPQINIDDVEDSEYSISSTAYLREPTKRFSSFAEYESHMAKLASEAEGKSTVEENTEE